MKEQTFVDGIGSIFVIGGTVRLELFTFSPTEKDANGQPRTVPQQTVVMTLPAFLDSSRKMQEAIEAIGKLAAPPQDGKPEKKPGGAVKGEAEPVPAKQFFP